MNYQREILTDALKEELSPLLQTHHEEVSPFKDIPLSVNWQFYFESEKAGFLRIFTARDSDRLFGYAIFFIGQAPHFSSQTHASQDALFLDERFRRGFECSHFIKWCDDQLLHCGVDVVYQHVTESRDFGHLLERIGYALMGKIYSRRIR
jgi:hypothetical protein